jgi:hypothetical protein
MAVASRSFSSFSPPTSHSHLTLSLSLAQAQTKHSSSSSSFRWSVCVVLLTHPQHTATLTTTGHRRWMDGRMGHNKGQQEPSVSSPA